MLREPWIGQALDLYAATDGRLGIEVLQLPTIVGEAMAVIGDAQAFAFEARVEQERQRRRHDGHGE